MAEANLLTQAVEPIAIIGMGKYFLSLRRLYPT